MMIGYFLGRYSGIFIGAAALSGGVIAAAVAAYLFARPVVRRNLHVSIPETDPLSWQELFAFYLPLALTSLILMAARPVLTVAISRLPRALDSLAVWPVLLSVSFLGRSIAMSYQEVGIALLQDRRDLVMLQRFARMLGGVMLLVFLAFVLSPLAVTWFRGVVGLSAALTRMARLPMLFIAIVPAVSSVISWKRGILVHAKRTAAITRSVIVNLIVLGVLLIALGYTLPANGALVAAIAYAGSVVAEWLYLNLEAAKAQRRLFAGA
jgi:MFS family permease